MNSQEAPPLTGPSEFAQSIAISVSPDVLPQDGASQSFITVTARDANSQPIRNLTMRTETRVGGTPVDFGVLSARSVVTGSDGRATLVYTAPPSPAVSPDAFLVVDVVVTPFGTDYNNSHPRSAAIRLVPQGTVDPAGRLWSRTSRCQPASPADHQTVLFDASERARGRDRVVPNGISATASATSGRTVDHDYELPGTYVVRLTVVDPYGRTASKSQVADRVGRDAPADGRSSSSRRGPTKVGQGVNFNALGVAGDRPEARIVSYTWDFGDGTLQHDGRPGRRPRAYTTAGTIRSRSSSPTTAAGRASTTAVSAIMPVAVLTVMTDTPRLEELRRRVQRDPASISFAALAEEYRRLGSLPRPSTPAGPDSCATPRTSRRESRSAARSSRSASSTRRRPSSKQVLRSAPENLAAIRALADIHRPTRRDAEPSTTMRRGRAHMPRRPPRRAAHFRAVRDCGTFFGQWPAESESPALVELEAFLVAIERARRDVTFHAVALSRRLATSRR